MAMPLQAIRVAKRQQNDYTETFEFTSKLTGADGEVLLPKKWTFKVDKDNKVVGTNDSLIYLPVFSNGTDTVDYELKIKQSVGSERDKVVTIFIAKTTGEQFLSELIAAGGAATDSVKSYIDAKQATQDLAIAAQTASIASQFAAINGALNLTTAVFTGIVGSKDCFTLNASNGTILSQWSTKGSTNHFLGYNVGNQTMAGGNNTFIGNNVGTIHTVGQNCVFVGGGAGAANTAGTWNSFIGAYAGLSNTTGERNAFFGHSAGRSNTIGRWNTFLGDNAGYYHIDGVSNTFIGMDSGQQATGGNLNTGVGEKSARSHQTGGNGNSSFGAYAGILCSTGNNNLFLGYASGQRVVTGSRNTLVGTETAWGVNGLATGSDNIFLGYRAGAFNTGSRNILIGNEATTADLARNDWLNIAGVITADLATNRVDVVGTLFVGDSQVAGIASGSGGDAVNVPIFGGGAFTDSALRVSAATANFSDSFIDGNANVIQFGDNYGTDIGTQFALNAADGTVSVTAPNGFYVNGVLIS